MIKDIIVGNLGMERSFVVAVLEKIRFLPVENTV